MGQAIGWMLATVGLAVGAGRLGVPDGGMLLLPALVCANLALDAARDAGPDVPEPDGHDTPANDHAWGEPDA